MNELAKLQSAVFGKQRVLAEIQTQYGNSNLRDYVNSWPISVPGKSTPQLAQTAQKLLTPVYGQRIAEEAAQQLLRFPLVSTIDHHGILNHPFFINSNLIFSQNKQLKYLVCLSTAGVSLNNSSWPGCFIFTDSSGRQKRLSFFPDKLKTGTVLAARLLDPNDTKKVLDQISSHEDLSVVAKAHLTELITQLFDSEIYGLPDFSAQASRLSAKLWSAIFPSAPPLVYLPTERLASEQIINNIIPDGDHILHRLFFTAAGLELINKHFSGGLGAFSSAHKGSFLFWGLDGKGRRVRLQRDRGTLTNGRDIIFKLAPDTIAQALLQNRLYPTGLVCFLTMLSSHLTCAGGFNQVNWLTEIKQRFLNLLAEAGETTAAGQIAEIPTKNFAEGNLAFLPGNNGPLKATGLDLYLTGHDYFPATRRLAEQITVSESLTSLLPEIYRIITPAAERQPALLSLTYEKIIEQTGLGQKMTSTLLTNN